LKGGLLASYKLGSTNSDDFAPLSSPNLDPTDSTHMAFFGE